MFSFGKRIRQLERKRNGKMNLTTSSFFLTEKTNSWGVLIGYCGTKKIEVINKKCDNSGRIFLLEINTDDSLFVLINICNANNEPDQVKIQTDLGEILDSVGDIFRGDFNVIFDSFLEEQGGKPSLKKHTLAKTIQIKEKFSLLDIWRIQNPKTKCFTFTQHHTTGFIQRRLDYFFISNQLQETVRKTDTLAAFTSDHYPLIFNLSMNQDETRGKGLWKFSNSLALNSDFVDKMLANTQKNLDKENLTDDQARWEYIKYEIRKFSIKLSKLLSNNTKTEALLLKKTLKLLECTANYLDNSEYISGKSKLDQFYEEKVSGIRIRSKCDWY